MTAKDNSSKDNYFLTIEEARKQISNQIKAIRETETVPLMQALNRVLAKDVTASFSTPPYNNSAMDGYALHTDSCTTDARENDSIELEIIGHSLAGHPFDGTLKSGETVRIMTGAKIPEGANSVIMQELTEKINDNRIKLTKIPGLNDNIRFKGEDLSIGDNVLSSGKKLSPTDLAYLATQGIAEVIVKRKVKVAIFSTGDELCPPGENLQEGQIYDSNRFSIAGMLTELDVDWLDLGIIPDDRQKIEEAFENASKQADVIITSGGVSVGDADYVKETLEREGDIGFWKISMKPGKPLAFGYIHDTLFFGLPGNPVSVIATFYQVVHGAIQQMMGQENSEQLLIKAKTNQAIKKRPGRTDFQRGIYQCNNEGEVTVELSGTQASHILTSMSKANCFIVLDKEQGSVDEGGEVIIQPFKGLMG